MSNREQQTRRNRLKKLANDILPKYREGVPFYDDYLRLINQRTDKIFEMINFILSQKDPSSPNYMRADSLKCIDCYDGLKRIYLTSKDSKSNILLTSLYLQEHRFYIRLPSEESLIDKHRFDSAVFNGELIYFSRDIVRDLFNAMMRDLEPIPEIIKDQKTPPPFTSHQLFDFEILGNKNILIKQSLRDRIVPFNIHSIDTSLNPCLRTKFNANHSYLSYFNMESFFMFKNSFEDHIQSGSKWNYSPSYVRTFKIGDQTHTLSFPVTNFANFTRYLVDPRISIIVEAHQKPAPNILNTLVSNLSSCMDDVNYNININSFNIKIVEKELKFKETWIF